MGKPTMFAAVSLDGFIATDDHTAGPLFDSGRPFFGEGGPAEPVLFEDPRIVQGRQVTHLVYDVRR